MGRTHGVHAEPTTFGLKLALWREEMIRNLERFDNEILKLLKQVKSLVQLVLMQTSTHSLNNTFREKLGLQAAPISTQTLQRDRHAQYMSTLALIATSIEKFATEVRGLQKSETREVEEAFGKDKKVHLLCHINVTQSVLKI
ncbi:Adenylosuccinate lyase OS=Ureibacillus acetophenoni OX=614649 GN=SAMN05877842_10812 PE=3 SV=1 [Ureibacillus acetophenoni]